MGLGVGFTIGAPLNYLVLQAIPKEESATGLATMSLLRSIGIAISPRMLIGFIVDASKNLQPKLLELFQTGMQSSMNTMNFNPTSGNSEAFKSLESADVTTIVDTFQTVINTGYTQVSVAAAIISLVGFIATLFLKKNSREIN